MTPGPSSKVQPSLPMNQCTTETEIAVLRPFRARKISMSPWARERNVEVVASRFRLEAAVSCRPGPPVRRDPVAKRALLTQETAVAGGCVVPAIGPTAIDEKAHTVTSQAGSM